MEYLTSPPEVMNTPSIAMSALEISARLFRGEHALDTTHDELTLLIHMDGQGTTAQKNATWRAVVAARPDGMPLDCKNFYDEDHPMLTPMVITYQ